MVISICCLITKLCPTLCNPTYSSPQGSSVYGISQAVYWRGLPFPSLVYLPHPRIKPTSPALAGRFFITEPSGKPQFPYFVVQLLIHVLLFATPWTVESQAPLSMGFSRQGSWSGLSFPTPKDLPDPGIEPSLLCPLHWYGVICKLSIHSLGYKFECVISNP